jgi:hypothetical protein
VCGVNSGVMPQETGLMKSRPNILRISFLFPSTSTYLLYFVIVQSSDLKRLNLIPPAVRGYFDFGVSLDRSGLIIKYLLVTKILMSSKHLIE